MDTATQMLRWGNFLQDIRQFFSSRHFAEVFTDCLVPAGAFEACLDTLKVSFASGSAELQTSPEIQMKKLLSQTKVPLFQIAKCFRDDPQTAIHKREFTMLEFYITDADYRATMEIMEDLLRSLAGPRLIIERISMREVFLRTTGLDLWALSTAPELAAAVQDRQLIAVSPNDSWADLFFKLLLEKVEPSLDPELATLIYDFPDSQCALGKINRDRKTTERFEVYWKGIELCNGCTELTDPQELKARYAHECAARETAGKKPHPIPSDLIEAMENGLPASSGVAVGLDRLFSCLEAREPRHDCR